MKIFIITSFAMLFILISNTHKAQLQLKPILWYSAVLPCVYPAVGMDGGLVNVRGTRKDCYTRGWSLCFPERCYPVVYNIE